MENGERSGRTYDTQIGFFRHQLLLSMMKSEQPGPQQVRPVILSSQTCTHPVSLGQSHDLSTCPRTLFPLVRNTHMEFGMEEIPMGSHVPVHAHSTQSELIFIHRGQARVVLDDVEYHLREGECIHIGKNVRHSIWNSSTTASLWITYTLTPPLEKRLDEMLTTSSLS